jgi:hypothetical protein
MALQNAGRPATARPVNEPPLSCAEADNAKIALNRLQPQAQREIAARLRRQRHVECLHRLGPAPLFHLLTDLDAGKPLWHTVEECAALPANFIKALGGDQFAPLVHVIEESGP